MLKLWGRNECCVVVHIKYNEFRSVVSECFREMMQFPSQ